MTDISKCPGEGCKKRDTCYRYTASVGQWQSWINVNPDEDGLCDYYIEVH